MRRLLGSALGLTLVATTLAVGGVAGPAHACSCVPSTDQQAFDQADAVFVGRVTEHDVDDSGPELSSLDPVVWTFDVGTVFKGRVTSDQEIVSPRGGGSCGLDLVEGDRYYVFGWLDSSFPGDEQRPGPGQFAAYLCNGTRRASQGPLDVPGVRGRAPGKKPVDVIANGFVHFDEVRTGTSDRELIVTFVGAPKTRKSDPCWEGYRARVYEDESVVAITIRRLHDATPIDVLVTCDRGEAIRRARITLREPLGDRAVYDGVPGGGPIS